ncbi:putative oxidoreductase [Mycobacterium heckeshornense]|uniref:SDR family NAD(P)-dependent oxidoreductase n=1 Tax=Mycobacterium heckeshornense TaxID=110505 RepID=UPI001941078F|nr:3-oxoacyl-ACP reductase family protein [Mycobacterium heckeshornense]BCQ07267.1 putative oxidoreductase [Mycobacterium heckeshornense]
MAGRVALVTGGTRGIGAAICTRLMASGATVVAVYECDEVAAASFRNRTGVSTLRADVGDPDTCAMLVDRVVDEHGRLDLLVNNAGLLIERPCVETTAKDWDRAVAVNLSAVFHLCRATIPMMRQHGFGRIVNISSVTAVMGSPSEAAYGAAKAGLHGLTRSLARETARDGITVNCVVPGVFHTDMTASMPQHTQSAILRMIPVGRRGDPDELARAVTFLLDDQSGYITGSILTVDGGLSMGA